VIGRAGLQNQGLTALETSMATLPTNQAVVNHENSIELAAVRRFHIADDAFLTLHRQAGGEWVNVGAFQPSELDAMLPQMREELERDAFFSVNALGLRLPRGRGKHLRYLNACYVDIDCYRQGLRPGAVMGRVMEAVGEQVIPSPTVFGFSGRGVWLFWLLRDVGEPHLRQRAFPEKQYLYARVQRELWDRLKHLGADANALDSSRVTRIPGSINSKVEERVHHFASLTPDGQLREYSLAELAEHVGVEERRQLSKFVRTSKRRVPKRVNGWIARWSKSHGLLQALRQMRGGFREGHRHNALFCSAVVGRRHGLDEPNLYAAVLELGQECKPPLPDVDALAAFRSAMSMDGKRHISTARILEMLGVTQQEREELKRFLPKVKGRRRPSKRALRTEERRGRIQEAVDTLGQIPTSTDLGAMLGEPQKTIHRDMAALGLIMPNSRSKKTLAISTPFLPFSHT